MRALVAIALALAGCASGVGPPTSWTIRADATVPASIVAALSADLVAVEGYCPATSWGGTLTVVDAPFACPGSTSTTGWCSGLTADATSPVVVYAPAVGLGPSYDSTAGRWEVCNARILACYGDPSEARTPGCVAWVAARGGP